MNKQLIAYILVSVVFVIVFGGVASILPSRRERQIGNLRVMARRYDLEVSVVQVADVNAPLSDRVTASGMVREPKMRCVAWVKHYPDEFEALPEWIIYASKRDETLEYEVPQHIEESIARKLSASYWDEVNRIYSMLPARCLALECTRTDVRWLGHETLTSTPDEFVHKMVQALDALLKLNISESYAQSSSVEQIDTFLDED